MSEKSPDIPRKEVRLEKRVSRVEHTVRELSKDEIGDRSNFRRLLFRNFIGGLVRGGGTIVGIALVGTVLVFILQWAARANIEWLSEFIAELIRWIQRNM